MTDLEAVWRKAMAPPERMGVRAWAEANLVLSTKVSPMPGPFRADRSPYIVGIFEAFEDPVVQTIYLCFGAQTAKTTAMLVCCLYGLAQDAGPTLWAFPSETLARSYSQERLQPLIDDTPLLAAEKPADKDRYKTLEMQFRRATLTLVGANSPANLSSRPIRYLLADEVDKFPIESVREGSALNLAKRRTVAFWNHKIVVSSTPSLADGQIWKGLLDGDWRQFWVPCSRCGHEQVLIFGNIRIPEGLRDEERIKREAWYECEGCHAPLSHEEKAPMLARGHWRPRADRVPEYDWNPPPAGGSVVSFHLPSWYSPWQRWGEPLARFIKSKPYPEDLREVVNQDLAEPWEERGSMKREEDVLAHRDPYPPGTVPSDAKVSAIIQTVDVQDDGLYYVVRAWGPSDESWQLAYGPLPDFEALVATFARDYGGFRPQVCLIDSGGHRAGEVYEFCRFRKGCLPLKGVDYQAAPVRWSAVDRMPDGTAIPGGVRLITVMTPHFRSLLFARMEIKRGDPGYWHLHAETLEDYARQIVTWTLVERKDQKGRRHKEWHQIGREDHYLDCEIYQLAGAHFLGSRYHRGLSPSEAPPAPAARPAAPASTEGAKQAKAQRWPDRGRNDPWNPPPFE